VTGDHIRILGIRGTGYHGVLDHERHDGQEFMVDVDLWLDLDRASHTDELKDTVDYGAIAHSVLELIEGAPCQLIETLGQRVADAVLLDERVESTTVTVHKPQAPVPVSFEDISVTINRRR
jgi:7,8-dihydroneopterin aldolase/epimerase/oxygenase